VWMCVSMYVKLEQGIVSVWMCVCTILHGVVRMWYASVEILSLNGKTSSLDSLRRFGSELGTWHVYLEKTSKRRRNCGLSFWMQGFLQDSVCWQGFVLLQATQVKYLVTKASANTCLLQQQQQLSRW